MKLLGATLIGASLALPFAIVPAHAQNGGILGQLLNGGNGNDSARQAYEQGRAAQAQQDRQRRYDNGQAYDGGRYSNGPYNNGPRYSGPNRDYDRGQYNDQYGNNQYGNRYDNDRGYGPNGYDEGYNQGPNGPYRQR